MRQLVFPPLLHAAIWSAFSVALALPILRQIHNSFGLADPPFSGLILLFVGLAICFVGAALIGSLCGVFGGKSGGVRWGAAFVGLLWSLFTAFWMMPTYVGFVVDDLARQGTVAVVGERENLLPRAKSAVEAYRQGKIADEARETGNQVLDISKNLAVSGLSRLPPLLIFAFAIVGAPIVAFWECRRAQKL